MNDKKKTYGQVAFEAWVKAIIDDNPKAQKRYFETSWDELGPVGQERWEKTVLAVIEYFDFHA